VINLFQPAVGHDELEAVGAVLASGWLGNGERARRFESAFAEYVGSSASQILTVSSCTEGLFQVLATLDVGPGDDVLLPSISFIGAAHAVRSTGARVVLCDVDPLTLNPTVDHVERALTTDTKAVLVLHYGGLPGEIAALSSWAREHHVLLIEDAACGMGSLVDGRHCGTMGDAGVWSFDPAKLMTTGDGGMIWCRNEKLAERLRRTIRLGVSTSGFARSSDTGRWWEIDPAEVGRRATMNDMAAAIGLVQLGRVPDFLRRRQEVATAYDDALGNLPWLRLPRPRGSDVAHTFYPVQTQSGLRDQLAVYLLGRGIYTNFRYWPLHRTGLYRSDTDLPGSDMAAATTLLLPVHQCLTDAEVKEVIAGVRGFPVPADREL
jgi:aminotransferase